MKKIKIPQIGLTEISFKKNLAIIDSNKFNYRNKIGEFKYIGIRDLVNNIRNTTVSKIDAKKDLNIFSKIKNAEIIKHKRRTSKHKELLNLFNDLSDTMLTDKTLMSSKDKNEKENGNDETLMSLKDDYDYENEDENDDDDDDDDETMSQNEIIKGKNDILDKIIDKSKLFEEQIKSLKKEKI